ncbi:MAG: BTAD domain-containing putative transcriptional regulator, partial [Anaerolineales bacterium]
MGSELKIYLFGPFVVKQQDQELRPGDWPRRKAAWLLQRLALDRRLPKERAIDFLWPNLDSSSGANNLYRTLHSIRKTLDEHLGAGTSEDVLEFEDGVLSLAEEVWIDSDEFSRLAKSDNPEDWEKALDLYRDDLLADEPNAEFTGIERDALRRLERETRLGLAAHYRQQGSPMAALMLLSELLLRDPADETAHRETMLTYASAGRRHDALRQYEACLEALDEELGLAPSPETRDLHLQLIRGEPIEATASAPSPWAPPPLRVAGRYEDFPTIGRQSQRELLLRRVDSAEQMKGGTVILIGEAGVGKTRLALQILERAREQGAIALSGACFEQEGQIPFQPFMEAFDRYLYEQDR